jgi:DNA integrity scanning protein DisA with diadenylate cyclase activity
MNIDTSLKEYTDIAPVDMREMTNFFQSLENVKDEIQQNESQVKAIGSKKALHALQEELRQRGYRKAK